MSKQATKLRDAANELRVMCESIGDEGAARTTRMAAAESMRRAADLMDEAARTIDRLRTVAICGCEDE